MTDFRSPSVDATGGRDLRRHVLALFAAAALLSIPGTWGNAQVVGPPKAPPEGPTTLDLERLMQLEVVFAASKRYQNPREVASVVSVVTASEIRQHGYRTLADILRTVPSFYVTSDRNYSYVGVRGFAQPGDYSSRILLLVDGLRTNDNIYDMAYVGEEFFVDVGLIDRVEVVRGPSGAVYGSSAFFAVVNVVTKRGSDIQAAEVSASGGSLGTRAARATFGKALENGVDVVVSASAMVAAGQSSLYYREFDSPATNNGIADSADGESSYKVLAKVTKGGFGFSIGQSSRRKTIPTGSYGSNFNDPRSYTVDQTGLGSASYGRTWDRGSLAFRLHGGRAHYHAEYAFDPSTAPNYDLLNGKWWGTDIDGSRAISNHLLTGGIEFRDNFQQDQDNYDPDPFVTYIDAKHSSSRLGAFVQDELRLAKTLILYGGVRYDWFETFGTATSPRIGLIYNPGTATTLKLLLGSAFRAPNEYELHYGGVNSFKLNPELGPERIRTVELAGERRIGHGVHLNASAFRNTITDLISLGRDPVDSLVMFENRGRIDSRGLEVGLAVNQGQGLTGDLSFTLQSTRDRATHMRLTNSPFVMGKLNLAAPLIGDRLSAGVDAQYVSGRNTLAGAQAKPFVVTNFSLLAPGLFRRLDMSASVYNLFGTIYGHPGSEEHLQDVILQDGRSLRVTATIRR